MKTHTYFLRTTIIETLKRCWSTETVLKTLSLIRNRLSAFEYLTTSLMPPEVRSCVRAMALLVSVDYRITLSSFEQAMTSLVGHTCWLTTASEQSRPVHKCEIEQTLSCDQKLILEHHTQLPLTRMWSFTVKHPDFLAAWVLRTYQRAERQFSKSGLYLVIFTSFN